MVPLCDLSFFARVTCRAERYGQSAVCPSRPGRRLSNNGLDGFVLLRGTGWPSQPVHARFASG
jgi:hypothetical protein